jgi:hypothetical protein
MKYMECQHDCNCPHIPPLAATTSARKRTRTRTTTAATAAGAEAAGSSKYGDVQQEVLKHDATACLCTVWYSMVRTAWYSRSMVVPLLKSFQLDHSSNTFQHFGFYIGIIQNAKYCRQIVLLLNPLNESLTIFL